MIKELKKRFERIKIRGYRKNLSSEEEKKLIAESSMTIEEYLAECKKEFEEYQNVNVKCGIIGRSGVGKSSLINAIAGKDIAKVDEVESTMEKQDYQHRNITFSDLPGASTEKFPKEKYINQMNVKDFDCVIFVTADRFYEDDLYLMKEIGMLNIPLFVTRTKIDQSVDNAKRRGVSEEETLEKIRENITKSTTNINHKGIYLISSFYMEERTYQLKNLIIRISNSLSQIKKERFLSDINEISGEILSAKKLIAEKLMLKWAYLFSDTITESLDLINIAGFCKHVFHIFGINPESIKTNHKFCNKALRDEALEFVNDYTDLNFIKNMLILIQYENKDWKEMIPFVGNFIKCGRTYSTFAENFIEECYLLCIKIYNDSVQRNEIYNK